MVADAVFSRLETSQNVLQRRRYKEILLFQTELLALKNLKYNKQMYQH